MAYRPGQGLNKDACQRLRARRDVEDLPAQDDSQQRDDLLGAGAKKNPRCAICTRPICEAGQSGKRVECSYCTTRVQLSNSNSGTAKQRSHTPSTSADPEECAGSDDLDMSAEIPENIPKQRLKRHDQVSKCSLAAISAALEGRWYGDHNASYFISTVSPTHWLCEVQVGATQCRPTSLYLNQLHNTIHFGDVDGLFVRIEDVCQEPGILVWTPSVDPTANRRELVMRRSNSVVTVPEPPASTLLPKKSDRLSNRSAHNDAQSRRDAEWRELAAAASEDVSRQLCAPGNGGFVWIDGWGKRYSKQLGSLRHFLESQPDKFEVIPSGGKGFRVAFVQKQGRWRRGVSKC